MTKLLIDMDILTYRAGFAAEKKTPDGLHVEPVENAYSNVKRMMNSILMKCNSTDYVGYLTASNDETNFRKLAFPTYKENRKKYKRPEHYEAIRNYLSTHYNCITVSGIEADDALSIAQYAELDKYGKYDDPNSEHTIIVSIDKDLDIVPGWHYNFVKDKKYFMTILEGKRLFYKQLLTGDAVDNIPRIKKGWKKKEAFKLLDKALTEQEMYAIVYKEIERINTDIIEQVKQEGGNSEAVITSEIELRALLLWPKRTLGDIWKIPV